MATQLQAYLATNNNEVSVKGRSFTISGLSVDGDIAMATFQAARAKYTGMWCSRHRVAGDPSGEVWSVMDGRGREVACFAVSRGDIRQLAR